MAELNDDINIDEYFKDCEGEDDIAFDFHQANKPVKPDPKEMAKDLEAAFTCRAYVINPSQAKKCAVICCDEIMKVITFANYKIWHNEPMNLDFWQQVKEEIK